jgi:hypothetical protein
VAIPRLSEAIIMLINNIPRGPQRNREPHHALVSLHIALLLLAAATIVGSETWTRHGIGIKLSVEAFPTVQGAKNFVTSSSSPSLSALRGSARGCAPEISENRVMSLRGGSAPDSSAGKDQKLKKLSDPSKRRSAGDANGRFDTLLIFHVCLILHVWIC